MDADKSQKVKRRQPGQWRRLRQTVQILALALFIYLLLGTWQRGSTFLPYDLFFRLDPLVGLSAMLADRRWIPPLALSVSTLLVTFAFGRVWCGWLCPLGTLLDWTPARHWHRQQGELPGYWRQVKHLLLFTILLATIFGSLTWLILDPLTLLFRTLASVVMPALSFLIIAAEDWLYNLALLRAPLEQFDRLVRGPLLTEQPFSPQNLLIASVFIGVLALNAVRSRSWCRYLCPLGALLGLVSKFALFRHRVDELACIDCYRCARVCPTGTIDQKQKYAADPAECTLCLSCVDMCPTRAISFPKQTGLASWEHYDPSRRQLLASVGIVVGMALLRIATGTGSASKQPVRPPGADREYFVSRCIRCGECVKVCPTGGLQPTFSSSGWDELWTPALVPRLGYCDYSCNACGKVCPTEAIPPLSLEEKRIAIIGIAHIDKERCIPWAENRDCIVCEEMCPVPQKAILLQDYLVRNDQGNLTTVRRPRVITDLCIGCGICEYQCPVNGEAAIRIFADGDGIS